MDSGYFEAISQQNLLKDETWDVGIRGVGGKERSQRRLQGFDLSNWKNGLAIYQKWKTMKKQVSWDRRRQLRV